VTDHVDERPEDVAAPRQGRRPARNPSPTGTSSAHSITTASPFADAIEPFAHHMAECDLAESTIGAYGHDLGLLAEYLGEGATLGACSTERLRGFVRWLRHERDAPCSLCSLDRRISAVKMLFSWLAATGALPEDPAEPLLYHGATSPLPEILSEEDIARVLQVTESMRDAAESPDARPHLLISLLLETGIKKSEALGIELGHLGRGERGRPTVYIHYDKPRQRFKSRRLALPLDWSRTYALYRRRYAPRTNLFECTGRNLEYVLHGISDLAGLETRLTFDMLRWTSATRALREGMDPERLRRKLGLSRIAWREAYEIIQELAEGAL